jgi:hypothetical protein
MGLAEKLHAVHRSLDDAGVPHAFGGAIALGYCIAEPRATVDLDINVFAPVADAPGVLRALPPEITVSKKHLDAVARNAQVRLRWDDTPIDLFFSNHEFHAHASARVRTVPFDGEPIPILDCTDLVVLKAVFNRPKDWADIELTDDIGAIDHAVAGTWIGELLGTESPIYRRLAAILEGKRGRDAKPLPFPFVTKERPSDVGGD